MSHHYDCDECGELIVGDPINLAYWRLDEDGDPEWADWHICSWACGAEFCINQAVETMNAD